MGLKIYTFNDPLTNESYDVYEYPSSLTGIVYRDTTLVSKDPCKIPIMVVPNVYLVEKPNHMQTFELNYANWQYVQHFEEIAKEERKEAEHNTKISKISELFAYGSFHKYIHTITFFTGPKHVYKQTFNESVIYDETQRLIVMNRAFFKTIESCSMKGVNNVFVTGECECMCCGESVENTQCKITITPK